MPLVTKKAVSKDDKDSVLNNVLDGTAQVVSCPEFADPTDSCNGLGNVFGFKYKDATSTNPGSLELWLWLPNPATDDLPFEKGDEINAYLAERYTDTNNPDKDQYL